MIGAKSDVVFVSMPRMAEGIPYTLGYVTNETSSDGNPLIAPYPNEQWHKVGDCDSITSVYRVMVHIIYLLKII